MPFASQGYPLCSYCCLGAVVLACRDQKRGEQLKLYLEENARQHGNDNPQAELMLLDVSSLQSVRSFAHSWNQRPLHCLVNNAGIFDIGGGEIMGLSPPDHSVHTTQAIKTESKLLKASYTTAIFTAQVSASAAHLRCMKG